MAIQDIERVFAERLDKLNNTFKRQLLALARNNRAAYLMLLTDNEAYNDFKLSIYGSFIDDYQAALEQSAFQQLRGFAKLVDTEQTINRIDGALTQIKENYGKTVLGRFESNAQYVKSQLLTSSLGGQLDLVSIRNIAENTPLTGAQSATVVQTSFYDVARGTVFEAFRDSPNQKFKYVGPVDEDTSDVCMWMMNNQDEGGYKAKLIFGGLGTPFGDINQTGRVPNFNCRHTWRPIIKTKSGR